MGCGVLFSCRYRLGWGAGWCFRADVGSHGGVVWCFRVDMSSDGGGALFSCRCRLGWGGGVVVTGVEGLGRAKKMKL
jgi:hypothetical protein